MSPATFDATDHATTAGWATRWARPYRFVPWHRQIRCRLSDHAYPADPPEPPNGYSPTNTTRCRRCRTLIGWHVVGQHRYGGLDK
jgi:hypothetical protein